MALPVLRGAAGVLVHAPDLVRYGCEPMAAAARDPVVLERLLASSRSWQAAVAYPPNQVFVGNLTPGDLKTLPQPWHRNLLPEASSRGQFGAILSEAEFYVLLLLADTFDLVWLDREVVAAVAEGLAERYPFVRGDGLMAKGRTPGEVEERLRGDRGVEALPLYLDGRLVGCVVPAAEADPALSAHVILENLACKASGAVALYHALQVAGMAPADLDYALECSEVAVGDKFQRGGGNLAKALAEMIGATAASGADVRAFCAAPVHAVIHAAALVSAGVSRAAGVAGGGSLAKLGMNFRSHIGKGLPVLEDCLAAVAAVVAADDGRSPVIRLDGVGLQVVGAGTSPQAVTESLVMEPLHRLGLTVNDVGAFAAELQNPEITRPAGAGDVPRANYRMIGALAVKHEQIARKDFDAWIERCAIPGFAPTQGHCPAGVPYIPHALAEIRAGRMRRSMIIGKGSLFLGRMTGLSDGASFILEANPAAVEGLPGTGSVPEPLSRPAAAPVGAAPLAVPAAPRSGRLRVALALGQMESSMDEFIQGAREAARDGVDVLLVGPRADASLPAEVTAPEAIHSRMEALLAAGEVQAAVATHYPFPLGVATVGRVLTPARGRQMFIASTTGTAHADRVQAMLRNAVYGVACARACGVEHPTVGILNVDGARLVEGGLRRLQAAGYALHLATSGRADGGAIMRGNDILLGTPDVLVTDTLTGNLVVKMLGAYIAGGEAEVLGWGYGPGLGPGFDRLVLILSRASRAPVVAAALRYAHELARSSIRSLLDDEWARAREAGLESLAGAPPGGPALAVATPLSEERRLPLDREIEGIDVLAMEAAVVALRATGVHAEPAMGCTGPVLKVAAAQEAAARRILAELGHL